MPLVDLWHGLLALILDLAYLIDLLVRLLGHI